MASGTRQVTGIGIAVFDFNTLRRGTVTFYSNDLNIDWRMTLSAPGVFQQVHAGPILAAITQAVSADLRVQIVPIAIGSGFAPPPLSLLQLQTDTVNQVPAD